MIIELHILCVKIMKVCKGKFGKVLFCDCIDETHGLPSLDSDSYELTLTDPQYNVEYKGDRITSKDVIVYEDKNEDYYDLMKAWFTEAERISKRVVFTPGNKNLRFWVCYKKPVDLGFHYKKTSPSPATAAYFCVYDLILFYGVYGKKRVNHLVFDYLNELTDYKHPCPKTFSFWEALLLQLEPESVLDPFMGSGTTAHVCEKYGIKYLGYELKKEYFDVIQKRIQEGINERIQLQKNQGSVLEI